ncbi:MAG: twin-arginine translocase subunit TatC [Armatimonadetes bacterium]|nr:twin-arginine translocase subunit TatC [Armatimonadota bacterium]NIM24282.1 twin-arginine translocase subunit TatC [Armatimonadota bacterium]NIM68151.1 twin-arginine translocase subunit TatC [Armatimonadota bacterium]NIM76611.1 twin-arginine translocase subunit TatC [Armatimonadota bacterium]NIN06356.1 twin-arginine translocase subunit TatC [Armatimonadota bacterium]
MEEDRRLALTEHLEELRARIIRSLVYVMAGMSICWILYPYIFRLLERPVLKTLQHTSGTLQVLDIMEPFWVRCQVSLVAGLALALPFVLLEVWGFVRPGLTQRERRVIRTLPLVVFALFLCGVAFGYWMCSVFLKWLLSEYFVLPGMTAQLRVQGTILFLAKLLLAFGIGFQLPVLIVLLNRLGILPEATLRRRWREATVAVFIIAAIITPSWDPISMMLAAMPLALLYLGTWGVIILMERRAKRATKIEE